MTTTFIKDSQSRIVRYGCKAVRFDEKFNTNVQAYAFAKKKGNKFIVSSLAYGDLYDLNGNKLSGEWKIIKNEGKSFICSQIN